MRATLELLAAPDTSLREIIVGELIAFNQDALAPGLHIEPLAIVLRDETSEAVLGGLWGRTGWDWLTIELIFVPEALRGNGFGRSMIDMAEAEAVRRGCHSAWLDTLNPSALVLYERLGYVRFGELSDFPKGQTRYFLQKRLDPGEAAA
jgi:GNAT superfamily N-acetyltransferase